MKTLQETYNITETEKEIIIQHIAERFKNFVFLVAEQRTRSTLDRLWDQPMDPEDQIRINWSTTQVVCDIEVALGEHRIKSKVSQE